MSWTVTEQSVPGHPELGLYGAQMVETPNNLFLLGGHDGHRLLSHNWISAYNQYFGFYDTGLTIPHNMYDFSAITIDSNNSDESNESDVSNESKQYGNWIKYRKRFRWINEKLNPTAESKSN